MGRRPERGQRRDPGFAEETGRGITSTEGPARRKTLPGSHCVGGRRPGEEDTALRRSGDRELGGRVAHRAYFSVSARDRCTPKVSGKRGGIVSGRRLITRSRWGVPCHQKPLRGLARCQPACFRPPSEQPFSSFS